jgi:ABC-type multidrug transport system ATPase subunit
MSPVPDPIISVRDLGYTYRRGREKKRALDGLSFSVQRGEIVGLLGPNGAGKSTAVKILTTILRPGSGTASVAGHDVAREPLAVRRTLAAVLQESAVETMLSTLDNLLLYGYLHGLSRPETKKRLGEVVELMELGGQLGQRAQELSGGYKRRLQVAKALMVDTPVLFLDEATTGMDLLAKGRTMQAIRGQATAGRTVLLTTQLLDEAESLCDRMVLMDEGRSMAAGKLSELRALAHKTFRIGLGFADPNPAAVAALRELGPRTLEEKGGEVSMVVEGSEDEWIRKMARISERWPLAHFEIRGVDLEQIFIQMYGGSARDKGGSGR